MSSGWIVDKSLPSYQQGISRILHQGRKSTLTSWLSCSWTAGEGCAMLLLKASPKLPFFTNKVEFLTHNVCWFPTCVAASRWGWERWSLALKGQIAGLCVLRFVFGCNSSVRHLVYFSGFVVGMTGSVHRKFGLK